MTTAIETTKLYFDFSNKSDHDAIAELLTDTTTYSSQTTGLYLGKHAISEMQRSYHGSFNSLHWHVNSMDEVKPGIVLVDYDFEATRADGEHVQSSGLEYVIAQDGKLLHIEIRNK